MVEISQNNVRYTSYAKYDNPSYETGVAASTSVKPGLLVAPSVGTYGSGYDVVGANFGDGYLEGDLYLVEVSAIHPESITEYDKATAYAATDRITVIVLEVGKIYELAAASTFDCTKGEILVCGAGGLIVSAGSHTTTPITRHCFTAQQTLTNSATVLAKYIGFASPYSADS